MPELSGPELQVKLNERGANLPVIFVTGESSIPASVAAIRAGADDFLIKPVPKDVLVAAIERAIANYSSRREKADRLARLGSLVKTLTAREREVFELIVSGKLNRQAAQQLGTAERTIKAHRRKVMEKLHVESLAELVVMAERLGLVAKSEVGGNGIQQR
jgi:FixJ family two-component response regulator